MPRTAPGRTSHIRLEPGVREQLDRYCEQERRDLTSAVNLLLDAALAPHATSGSLSPARLVSGQGHQADPPGPSGGSGDAKEGTP